MKGGNKMKDKQQLEYIRGMVGMSLNKAIDNVEQLEELNSEISTRISEQKESIRTLEMAMSQLNRLMEEDENEKNQCK
jgi:hypothetical protein